MHPQVVADKPGSCPICGMDLVPIREINNTSTVVIPAETRQRIGLKLGTVEKRPLAHEIRTSARIVSDETRLYHVTLKTEGWIEHFHTIYVGKFIQKGEPLMVIYSPELLTTAQVTNIVASITRFQWPTLQDGSPDPADVPPAAPRESRGLHHI